METAVDGAGFDGPTAVVLSKCTCRFCPQPSCHGRGNTTKHPLTLHLDASPGTGWTDMGSIHIRNGHLLECLSETVGYKAGVALGREEIQSFFADEGFGEYQHTDDDRYFRIESVVFEDMIEALLYKLGRLEKRHNLMPAIYQFHKYKNNKKLHELSNAVMDYFSTWLEAEIQSTTTSTSRRIDPTSFIEGCLSQFGTVGGKMGIEIVKDFGTALYASPWYLPPETKWDNIIELSALFDHEDLNAFYGEFFDQRYIDYLHRNFGDIDKINWRQFENLTAEYFVRCGYKVELGPGRGDDGVDVRVWLDTAVSGAPPEVIVQCKRQRNAVEKVVVKALYADVIHEQAQSGMIVTTSRLAPGARQVCSVRNYPVRIAERETLRQWLKELRVPGTGIVL